MKYAPPYVIFLLMLIGCNTDKKAPTPPKTLELRAVTVANNGSAQIVGRVIADKDAEIGVVYGPKSQPTLTDTKVVFGRSNGGNFDVSRNVGSSLPTNQKLYFRLYTLQEGQAAAYSNEGVYYNSPLWKRLPDLIYDGNPLPDATLTIVLEGPVFLPPRRKSYSILFRTKTLDTQEQTGRSWLYFPNGFAQQWFTTEGDRGLFRVTINPFSISTVILDAGYTPTETLRAVGGGGYYYIPQLYPPLIYQKTFIDNVGAREPYPGADTKTLTGAIGKTFPEIYILEVGGAFNLWNFTRLQGDTPKWAKAAAFPNKSSANLAMFNTQKYLYVVVEDAQLLYRFDPKANTWQQMKNLPFAARQKGVGFSFEENGYYGLGYNPSKGESYRDIWRYNEAADSWAYAAEYPGTGTVGVAVAGGYDYLFLGLGFQSVPTKIGTMQIYPAPDVWQFKL